MHADPKGFDSTDKLFQKIFNATEIIVVDANMGHSEDVQILTRLLQCLMNQGILYGSEINEDDIVRSKSQIVLKAALQGFEEGHKTLEDIFKENDEACDSFLTLFREKVSFSKQGRRKHATATPNIPQTDVKKEAANKPAFDTMSAALASAKKRSVENPPSSAQGAAQEQPLKKKIRKVHVKGPITPATAAEPTTSRESSIPEAPKDETPPRKVQRTHESSASSSCRQDKPVAENEKAVRGTLHVLEPESTEGTLRMNATLHRLRAFANLGNSCFLNASLTALLSVKRFQVFLREVWDSETLATDREALAPIALNLVKKQNKRMALFAKPDTNEQRLAATFMAALTPPQSSSQYPYLLTDLYYRERQEDAQEFISKLLFSQDLETRLIERRTRIERLCITGHRDYLKCLDCNCKRAVGGDGVLENMLHLPLLRTSDNTLITSVQDAVNVHFEEQMTDADFRFECDSCDSKKTPAKGTEILSRPEVLIIHLVRWQHAHAHGALLHHVDPSKTLVLQGSEYKLVSFIDHIGERADHGHYTATVRDLSDSGTWLYYNNSFVGPAGRRKLGDHKLYICFYELQR